MALLNFQKQEQQQPDTLDRSMGRVLSFYIRLAEHNRIELDRTLDKISKLEAKIRVLEDRIKDKEAELRKAEAKLLSLKNPQS